MATFTLKIVTPDGCKFDGQAKAIFCRTITGDVGILANHSDYCTALGRGSAHVVLEDGATRYAACIGGMIAMLKGECHLMATTWEWAEEIDKDRALASKARAEAELAQKNLDAREQELAQARLKRALVRSAAAR